MGLERRFDLAFAVLVGFAVFSGCGQTAAPGPIRPLPTEASASEEVPPGMDAAAASIASDAGGPVAGGPDAATGGVPSTGTGPGSNDSGADADGADGAPGVQVVTPCPASSGLLFCDDFEAATGE